MKTAFFGLLAIMVFGLNEGVLAETYTYDAVGRLTSVAYGDGSSMTYTYDPNGNLLSVSTTDCTDVDEDGFGVCDGDCNDGDSSIHPDALEACNGIDDDCDGTVDGFATSCGGPGECASAGSCTAGVDSCIPGAPSAEVCDGLDNDCDGKTDGPDAVDAATWYEDSDGDAFGNAAVSQQACSQPLGFVSNSADCEDTDAAINPTATEICDGQDNNCDGMVDEECPVGSQPAVAVCDGLAHYAWVGFSGAAVNPDIFYRNCAVGGSCASIMKLVGAPTVEASPAVACEAETVIVMWEDYRSGNPDLAYRRSTDGGSFFSGLQFLVQGPSDETKSALAISGGVAIVVWEDSRNGNRDLATRRSLDGGGTWGPLTFLVRSPFDDTDPVLGLDGSAGLIGWVDRRFGNQDIAYRRSADTAASWLGLTFLVKAATVEKTPTLMVDGSTMLIAWSDSRFGNEDLAQRRSTSSGASFDGLKFLVRAPSDDSEPSIECSGFNCLLTWVDQRNSNRNISFRHSADGGATWGPTRRLVAAPTDELSPACDMEGDLAACVWADTRTGEPKPHTRHSLDGGMTWLSRFELDP